MLDRSFSIRMTPAMLKEIDVWRRRQEPIPTRVSAIRMLVAYALTIWTGGQDGTDI